MTDINTPRSTSSEAFDINDAGQIVGYETFGGRRVATLFNPMTGNVGLGGTNSVANAINNRPGGGLIVGRSGRHAALFGFGGRVIDLGTLGGTESEARDISDAGQIVGVADLPGGADRATLFGNNPINRGGNISLGTLGGNFSRADAINNQPPAPPLTPGLPGGGIIVGSSTTPSSFFAHAALFGFGGRVIDLGTLGGRPGTVADGSLAADISDAGQIVGSAYTPGGREVRAATLFGNNPINPGPNVRLGSLGVLDGSFRSHPLALDPNMATLWKAFEHWLIKRFPEATTLATPFNDPLAHSIEEYHSFLRSLNYTPITKVAFGRNL